METIMRIPWIHLLALAAWTPMMTHAAEVAPVTGTPSKEAFTLYEYHGAGEALGQVMKYVESDPRFKELGCERTSTGKSGRASRYLCKQNTGATYEFFLSGLRKEVQLNSSSGVCPTGCYLIRCPPPSGPYKCCNPTTYQPC